MLPILCVCVHTYMCIRERETERDNTTIPRQKLSPIILDTFSRTPFSVVQLTTDQQQEPRQHEGQDGDGNLKVPYTKRRKESKTKLFTWESTADSISEV